jgi:hypothetical protein
MYVFVYLCVTLGVTLLTLFADVKRQVKGH